MYDVITLGSATIDVFAQTTSQLVKFITAEGEKDFIAYPSGSKIIISHLDFLVGGGGTNTAVAFSRLEFKTGFIGKIGTDENGFKVLHLLEQEEVDFLGVREGQTGYSIILDSIEEDRTILTFKGANNTLSLQDLSLDTLDTRWLYSSSMVEESFDTLKKLFSHFDAKGTRIAFNPSSYQAKQGLEQLKDILSHCEVLVLNLEEASLLLGHEQTMREAARLLSDEGPKIVVVTNGAEGATCYTQGKFYDVSPTPGVHVVETTGAGDAFASGFVAGLLLDLHILDSLRLGMVQAESVIEAYGAKNKLMVREEALKQLKSFQGRVQTESLVEHAKHHHHKQTRLVSSPWLCQAPQGKIFALANGQNIACLEELAYSLKFLPEEIYRQHVTATKNDFATWIQEVFGLEDLARTVSESSDRLHMAKYIIQYIQTEHTEQ